MAHRIRHAIQNEPLQTILSGDVESDETWIGPRKRGAGTGLKIETKTAVHALIQRTRPMLVRVIGRVGQKAGVAVVQPTDDDAARRAIAIKDNREGFDRSGSVCKSGKIR